MRKEQKFKRGNLVHVAKNLGQMMSHFVNGELRMTKDNLTTNASKEAQSTAFLVGAVSGRSGQLNYFLLF